jgi:hypothetical protein
MGSLQSKTPSSKKDQKKRKSKAKLPSLSSNNDNLKSKSKSTRKSKKVLPKRKVKRGMKKQSGGDQYIPTYTLTTQDWHLSNQVPPYAVDLNAGINSYVFGRTTPNNDFVVATGLVNNCNGIEMVGGKKKKSLKKKSVKKVTKKVTVPKKKTKKVTKK